MGQTILLRDLVIGVYLDRKLVTCVYELDEQRKLIAKTLIVILPQKLSFHLGHHLIECLSLKLALCHHAFATWHTAYLPALTHVGLLYAQPFKRYQLVSAPYQRLQQWQKL